jgi:hypothetical protein
MYPNAAAYLKSKAVFLSQKEKSLGVLSDAHKTHVANVWLRDWIDLVGCSPPNGKKDEEKQIDKMYIAEIHKVSIIK